MQSVPKAIRLALAGLYGQPYKYSIAVMNESLAMFRQAYNVWSDRFTLFRITIARSRHY